MAQLQRKDLAKEFSQIVQQEIKNHNDLLLASNMAIESLRNQYNELKVQCGHRFGASISEMTAQRLFLDQLKESFQSHIDEFRRSLNDSVKLHESQLNALRKATEIRESYFLTLSGFEQFKKKIDEWIAHIQLAFKQQQDIFSQQINSLIASHQQNIDLLRKEQDENLAKEAEKISEHDKQFDIFALNIQSLKQEIERLNKRCFILEKNNENIYTEINRLKVQK